MADDNITLTPQEFEDIKTNERFQATTTLTLKRLCQKLDKLSGIRTHVNIQWFLISMIMASILWFKFM